MSCNSKNAKDTENYLAFLTTLRKGLGNKLITLASSTTPFNDASGNPSKNLAPLAKVSFARSHENDVHNISHIASLSHIGGRFFPCYGWYRSFSIEFQGPSKTNNRFWQNNIDLRYQRQLGCYHCKICFILERVSSVRALHCTK